MAFFGLTALGPQNEFSSKSTIYRYIQIFDADDFTDAWLKVNGEDKLHCFTSTIPKIMNVLFHGPIPESDRRAIEDAFDQDFETPNTISYDVYMKIMHKLRDDAVDAMNSLEGKPKPVCEFNSSAAFNESIKKNSAMKMDLKAKQTSTLTATQEYGWNEQELKPPVASRPSSDITKFASELIKNGIYY